MLIRTQEGQQWHDNMIIVALSVKVAGAHQFVPVSTKLQLRGPYRISHEVTLNRVPLSVWGSPS